MLNRQWRLGSWGVAVLNGLRRDGFSCELHHLVPVNIFVVDSEEHLVLIGDGQVQVDLGLTKVNADDAAERLLSPSESASNATVGIAAVKASVKLALVPVETATQTDLLGRHVREEALDRRAESSLELRERLVLGLLPLDIVRLDGILANVLRVVILVGFVSSRGIRLGHCSGSARDRKGHKGEEDADKLHDLGEVGELEKGMTNAGDGHDTAQVHHYIYIRVTAL